MADNSQGGIQPPYLDPSSYPDYMDMQRKQMLAQMLMQNMQQGNQTPANWDRMKVVPHRGLLQNLAPLASALLAGKAMKSSQQAEQKYFQNVYGGGQPQQGAPTGPGAGIVSPDASPDAQGAAQQVTDQPPRAGLLPQQPNPMLPPGASRTTAQQALGLLGPQEYGKGVVLPQLMGSPEWQTALRANNGNVQAAQQQLLAEARVKGTTHMRQGEDIMLPNGQTIRNPALGPGETLTRDAQGNPQSVSLIPGAAEAAGTLKGTTTAADVANTPRLIPMGSGSEALRYPGDVPGLGAPPALRGQAPPGAPQQAPAPRSYFPPPQQVAPPQSAPQAGPQLPQKDENGIFSNNLWSGYPKVQIPTTPGQTTDMYTQGRLKSKVDKDAELTTKYGEQAALANQAQQYYAEALKNLPKAETGPSSDWITHNSSLAMELLPKLGIDPKKFTNPDGTVATVELNKELKNAALQGAKATYGKLTQMEVKLQTDEMSPSSSMPHDAIAALIRQNMMRSAYQVQQAKDYQEYSSNRGDPQAFESQYNVHRPITRFAAQYDTPQPALERLSKNPHMLPGFKRQFGWDPTP
jgi:hypothetical protein